MTVVLIIAASYFLVWFIPFKEKPKRRKSKEHIKRLKKPNQFPTDDDFPVDVFEVSKS